MKRVRLIKDFTDEFDQSFKAGQVGTVIRVGPDGATIDFDGHEKERVIHQRMFDEHREGFNIIPWIANVPVEMIVVVPGP